MFDIFEKNRRKVLHNLPNLFVFADELGEYMNLSLKPNFKLAGPVLGKNIKQFGDELAKLDAAEFVV